MRRGQDPALSRLTSMPGSANARPSSALHAQRSAHGHSNALRQADLDEDGERLSIEGCRTRMQAALGKAPDGWLSPWIPESAVTPDLLREAGFRYTLNWCHDDQPTLMHTRAGPLWSGPYPQELNDIPMIVDQFDEMLEQAHKPADPLGCGGGVVAAQQRAARTP